MTVIEFIQLANFVQPAKAGRIAGLSGCYSGYQLEDPSQGYLVFLWPDIGALHLAKSTTAYVQLTSSAGTPISSYVVPDITPEENIKKVLEAPVTEFAVAKLRPELANEKNEGRWLEIADMTSAGITVVDGGIAGVRADRTEDDEKRFAFLFGWISLEHHQAALASPFAEQMIRETQTLTDFNNRHAKLRKHL